MSSIEKYLKDSSTVIEKMNSDVVLQQNMLEAAEMCANAIYNGQKILICGNGGSASDAQHIAAEFVGRFTKDRRPLPAIALTADSAIITALANDFGFEHVFGRQIQAIGNYGDVLVAISTSGKSPNILKAIDKATQMGISVVFMAGEKITIESSYLPKIIMLNAPSEITSQIQECHIIMAHAICGYIEEVVI